MSGTPWRIAQLPKWLLCIPLVAQWFWLGLRYRSLTLPSAINPSIETGGLAGESKCACLAQIADEFAGHVAAWRRVGPDEDPVAIVGAAGLAYPLIAKPDIGWCGYGVRRVADDADLRAYAAAFPPEAGFMVQHLVTAPNEAGLFYRRTPGEAQGTLLAMTLRHPPRVRGDGSKTVSALAAADPSLRVLAESLDENARFRVPEAGELVPLTTVASLRIGARYEDASDRITPALAARIDAIAASMQDFHLGRFDVRFETMAALQEGALRIIEVNGAGSEAIHLWDPALPIGTAFAGVFAKQRMLFALGAQMRERGHRPVGVWALSRAWLHQQRLIGRYPPSN